MKNLSIDSAVSVLQVKNLKEAIEWYSKLLGRKPDISLKKGVFEWQLTKNAWLQIITDTSNLNRLGKGRIIISVNGIQDQKKTCDDENIASSEIFEYLPFIKMFKVIDLDGNQIYFIEDMSNK